jgi:23S rRNA (cytosine1962-C5)-methyltransferase
MRVSGNWTDYELLDTSSGERLERWGNIILIRPDPQIIWNTPKQLPEWQNYNARYLRSNSGGGRWHTNRIYPEKWYISYKNLTFKISPTGFKHTGLFPEQAVNWDYIIGKIENQQRPIKVLNLFAYTGGATLAAASAGAEVCHVDASKGMVSWARENAILCKFESKSIRWIVDDCKKFILRESKRGNFYDGIILDPPSYGRGPNGEIWKLEENIHELLKLCMNILSDNPLFFLLNSYSTGLSSGVMNYLLNVCLRERFGTSKSFSIISDEIGLPVSSTSSPLPCGTSVIADF